VAVEWFGDAILTRAMTAAVAAVNETTADAVQHAKNQHAWRDETGALENAIEAEPASVDSLEVTGDWGVAAGERVPYWIDLEFGTVQMPARPFLRPAADAANQMLAARLRAHYGP
jgi:HK97 gp10 family phage protein